MNKVSDEQLEAEHTKAAIAARLDSPSRYGDLGDMVLGAVDGTVTTFAIVSGVAGTDISHGTLLAFTLGLANVLADGFSMGASNYLKARSDLQTIENYRKKEEMHIRRIPESEREEIRQIYIRKGFSGDLLEQIVEQITQNKQLWVETMLTDEWGLHLSPISPLRSATLTFGAFLVAGTVPLLPLLLGLFSEINSKTVFLLCGAFAGIVFLITGALRGKILEVSISRSAVETFVVGGVAAAVAYLVGNVLGTAFSIH
ncbi:MAG: VIT1/CCC1 transporter family protein [Bdellovibrionales bacterium]|nr:VIT1/CCC1 transporter family protein [Bdellovibrionales bacterium]